MKHAWAILALLLTTAVGPLAAQEPALSVRQEEGRRLFQSTCVHCHGPKVWGTFTLERRLGADHGLLEKRTDLVAPFVTSVAVRFSDCSRLGSSQTCMA